MGESERNINQSTVKEHPTLVKMAVQTWQVVSAGEAMEKIE